MSADFQKTAVIGAGAMGGEIAMVISAAGLPVVLKDIDRACLDAGMEKARALYAFKVKRRRMTQERMDEKMALISPTLSYDGVEAADVVIEAVPENLELKRRVFAELDGLCKPEALLASNTSALSVTKMAEAARRPERVAGFHFFNPASFMRLVEVIRGEKTGEQTVGRLCAFAGAIGKTPVRVADSAGFIVNRLLCAALIEAIRCEAEGLAAMEEIDSAMIKPDAGLPTGLYKMADQLGMDLVLHVMETIEAAHGDRFAPPEVIRRLVEKGGLGVKTGKGFYDYTTQIIAHDCRAATPIAAAIFRRGSASAPYSDTGAVVDRIFAAVAVEAKRLVAEGVATAGDINTAMRFGALFKKPPFAYIEELGAAEFEKRLCEYQGKYGERFKPPE